MRIGIDIRLIGKNQTGSEVYFFNLVKFLAEIDRENEYFLYIDRDQDINENLKAEIGRLNLGNNFKIIFIDSPGKFWWNLWALPHYLKKNPVDIFHTQYIAPLWLPKNIRLVLTIHDISFNFFPQFIKKSDLFFLKTLIPRGIRRADRIITVSEHEKGQIIDFYGIAAKKVDFVYNGVDFDRLAKNFSEDEINEVRKKYNLPDKFLLYVGTLQPRKNIPALIATFAALLEKHRIDGLKLIIVGNRKAHNFDKAIDESLEKYSLGDRVIFPGWVDDTDLPAVYRLADCFVFPSLYEGFGIPIVEAMAAGLPVVSSDKSCLPEIGQGAALFADPQNPDEFSEEIFRAVSDEKLRRELIENGTALAKKYTWRRTAEKTFEIYKSMPRA